MAAMKPRILTPLADLIDACLGETLAAQGFSTSDIITAWPEIVGEPLCRFSAPVKIMWPRRAPKQERPDPATLLVQVESAFALEFQHSVPVVLQRINTYYGWRCIGRITLKQGLVRKVIPKKPDPPALSEHQKQQVKAVTESVEDDALRSALQRLGTEVMRETGSLR